MIPRVTLADILGAVAFAAFVAVVIAGMAVVQLLIEGVPQ